jgi:hypothetical protein
VSTQPHPIVSKISGNQIIRTSAFARIELGCGGTYQITVGIERIQKKPDASGEHLAEFASIHLRL